jgi:hypothetical protein
MNNSAHSKAKFGFLCIVVSQTLHSLEEYYFRLWEVFAPARIASNFISDNVETGFLIINTTVVLFGFWSYFWAVSKAWRSAHALMWFWVIFELANSIFHFFFAIGAGGYFPGIFSAPLLFVSCCYTSMVLLQSKKT